MSQFELIFMILVIAAMGIQIGFALGIHKAYKVLIPVLNAEREEAAKLKLLARLHGGQDNG
ncbi:hypothetical protein PS870_01705 [Pseudomonas fluorescens]|jgi:hypothetical protein|uniref:Uncharacterized protein n=1 Tax=Pseudomonas fluorescens TaxID=294 RepID=A0A5E7IT57_PSEFL|nr:hypothetical protein [Pseudomonas fluorescens]VVO79310.1 hypothetical protein PS870_01705 [Pseudomonas fluorescens]